MLRIMLTISIVAWFYDCASAFVLIPKGQSSPIMMMTSKANQDSLPEEDDLGSMGVRCAVNYFNNDVRGREVALKLINSDIGLRESLKSTGFFGFGAEATIEKVNCIGIKQDGVIFHVDIARKEVIESSRILLPFVGLVTDEAALKIELGKMVARIAGRKFTDGLAKLPFGDDISLPGDFQFNRVPHSQWVRAYLYDRVSTAVIQAVNDDTIKAKSRLQLKVNFPELNPKFDTYRVGTVAELLRETCLRLAESGFKCKIVVQQSLGEGIFVGTPLALSSMMPVLQKMDWGTTLSDEQRYQDGDMITPRNAAYIRLGRVGSDQVAPDDDVIIIVSPQNVQGGEVIKLLDEMCTKAESQGTTVILLNPNLGDRPSGNDKMQIRGRAERRAIQDSFVDIYQLRLLYPSSGGYMYPIAGLVSKKNYRAPFVAYKIVKDNRGQESYEVIGFFPPQDPPSRSELSDLFV